MPAPRWLARFNRRVSNRLLGPLATQFPGLGVVVHTGRKTGREFRTPVLLFRHDGGFVIALIYGRESEWVRNVIADDGCLLEARGRTQRLTRPRLFHDERRRAMPALARPLLALGSVSDFLELWPETRAGDGSASSPPRSRYGLRVMTVVPPRRALAL